LFAGSAFIDIALAAVAQLPEISAIELQDVRFVAPLEVGSGDRHAVLSLQDHDDGGVTVTLSSTDAVAPAHSAWTRHARLRATAASVAAVRETVSLTALQSTLPDLIDHDAIYAAFLERGITLGHSVRGIQKLWRRDGEALSHLSVASSVPAGERRAALLDAALQTLGIASPQFSQRAEDGPVRVLARIGTVRVPGDIAVAVWCHATLEAGAVAEPWTGAIYLLDVAGETVAAFEGLTLIVPSAAALPDTLTYRLMWDEQPLPATTALPTCTTLALLAGERLVALGREHQLDDYDTLIPALEAAAIAYARDAFVTLGLASAGATLSDAQLEGVVPPHHRLVRRLAPLLHASDAAQDAPRNAARERARALGNGEMALLERCGGALAAVLQGSEDPLQLLFPQGSFAVLDGIYRDSAFARTYNGALRDALRSEIAARAGVPLRVLEIGAGTGGTTAYALDEVPDGSRYVFSDLSPLFLERARERFGSRADLRCELLDIERDPVAQGLTAGSFDVIIASNVLHATADIQRTLAHVRTLAAPGALLLLLEGTAPLHWVDLTFGLTEGWWRFSDRTLRPDHPLISADEWVRQLVIAGFGDAAHALPAGGNGTAFETQSLVLARTPVVAQAAAPVLILADVAGVGGALAAQLAANGTPHHVIHRSDIRPELLPREIAAFRAQHTVATTVVYLWALDIEPGIAADDVEAHTAQVLSDDVPMVVMRAVAAAGAPMRLWMVTCGAQAVHDGDAVPAPEQAPLWGWSRGFALEYPLAGGGCIDLDPAMSTQAMAEALAAELRHTSHEDQVAVRHGVRRVARLRPVPAPAANAVALRPDGAYLIAGGTGGLGLRVARWLAEHGAGELVLLSRSGLSGNEDDARSAALDAVRGTGCTVHVVQADVSDAAAMLSVLSKFGREWKPLRGVVHAAVQMSAAPIPQLSDADRASMRAGKVLAARLLHQLTHDQALDFFVLFSSTTSLLGVYGLAHYAAANQYLDALAHHRRDVGQVALSIAWGTWDVMRVASAEEQATIMRGGLRQLSSAVALDLMGRLIASGDTVGVVADVDWPVLVPLYETRRPRPLIHALATAAQARVTPSQPLPAARATETSGFDRVRAAAAAQRPLLLEQMVRHHVAAVLGYANDDGIPVDRGFFELGLDSLMSVELKRRLEAAVGQALPSTLTFNYPNVVALSGFLCELLFPEAETAVVASAAPARESPPARDTDDLSDEELEAELLARLEKLR